MAPGISLTPKTAHRKNLQYATTVARNSFFISLALALMKAMGGYVTNIVLLFGDAVGSFGDCIVASGIFIGLKLSQKKASKTFMYGYHRIETFISLCISILIIMAGYRIFVESIRRFSTTAATSDHEIGMATAVISIIVSLFIFRYQRKTAESIRASALLASAFDKRNDAFISLGVLAGVAADKLNIPYVEGVLGIGIALLVLATGLSSGKEALLYLLDYWDEPKITEQIKRLALKSKIVTAVKNIRLRRVGTYIFGEAFLEINPFTDSKDLRDEIHRLDRDIEAHVEHLGDIVLYIDPPKPTRIKVAIPVVQENGLHSHIAENPTEKFHFLFVEIFAGGIQKFYSFPELFSVKEDSAIGTFLKKQKTNILISSMIDPLLYYNLRLNNIKIYPHFLNVKDAENTVKLLLLDI